MGEGLTTFSNDGFDFDVLDDGSLDGPVVIALHGFPQTSTSWEAVTPRLTAAGFRVLAPDQRGYSPRARPRESSAYRLDRLAGDVIALADAAGAETFHVLGHDWGGAVAWQLASRHADRVSTVSVASTPHPRAMVESMRGKQFFKSWYMWAFQIPWLPERAVQARDGALLRRMMTSAGMNRTRVDEATALFAEPGAARGAINWYRAMRARGAPGPGRIRIPALYVWSDRDAALGRLAATRTEKWVTGPYRFEVLEGVSHWIPDDRPEELADLVLAHIAAHRPD
ncbi:MAG: alpha/beta fold hydrolase [Jatrophihabitans sp.]